MLPCQRHRNKQKATQAAEGMSKQQQAPHVILNVEPDASQEEVRTAFRQLAKTYHPDVSSDPDATVRFQEINDAYRAMIGREASTDPKLEMNDLIKFIAAEQARLRAQDPERWERLKKQADDRRVGRSQGIRGTILRTMRRLRI